MERSDEVLTFVTGFYDLMRAGDAEGTAAIVADDCTVFVGTDADEWWDTAEATRAAFREQMEASGGSDITAGDVQAFADGDIGWFADQPVMRMPDGASVTMRMTGVAVRTDDGWKCVQGHLSVGANVNEDLFDDD